MSEDDENFDFFEEPPKEPTGEPTSPKIISNSTSLESGEPPEEPTANKDLNKTRGPTTKRLEEMLKEIDSKLALFNDRITALEQKPSPSQIVPAPTAAISDGMKQDFATAIRTWLSATKPINSKTGKPNPAHDSPEINEKRVRMVKLLEHMMGETLTEVLKKTKLTEWWATNGPKPEA